MQTPFGRNVCGDKGLGEHLGCSPCGKVTCPHGGFALVAMVWPEVLLSRLPKSGLYPKGHAEQLFWGDAQRHWP